MRHRGKKGTVESCVGPESAPPVGPFNSCRSRSLPKGDVPASEIEASGKGFVLDLLVGFARAHRIPKDARISREEKGASPVHLLLELALPILAAPGEVENSRQLVEVFVAKRSE